MQLLRKVVNDKLMLMVEVQDRPREVCVADVKHFKKEVADLLHLLTVQSRQLDC